VRRMAQSRSGVRSMAGLGRVLQLQLVPLAVDRSAGSPLRSQGFIAENQIKVVLISGTLTPGLVALKTCGLGLVTLQPMSDSSQKGHNPAGPRKTVQALP
jgi:hypothetical protein